MTPEDLAEINRVEAARRRRDLRRSKKERDGALSRISEEADRIIRQSPKAMEAFITRNNRARRESLWDQRLQSLRTTSSE